MYLHKSIDGDEFETVTMNYGNHNINISVLVRNCFLMLMSAKGTDNARADGAIIR